MRQNRRIETTLKKSDANSLVSQAVSGAVKGEGRCRTGKLRINSVEHERIAGYCAEFWSRNLFHGVDQHRQPKLFVALRSPSPELLAHRLSLPDRYQPECRLPVPSTMPQRKSARCDLLHKKPQPPVVNLRHGPENSPNFIRSAARHPNRLRLDSYRRRLRADSADLSHPDLINR